MKNIAKLLFLFLVCFMFLGFGCKKQTTDTTSQDTTNQNTTQSTTDASTLDSSKVKNDVSNHLAVAKQKISYWDSNAKLVAASVDIDGSLDLSSLSYSYVYNSLVDNSFNKYYYWVINFNQSGQYLRALIEKEDYFRTLPSKPQEISSSYWQVNWQDALKKAEAAGGKDFRQTDTNNIKLNLSLYRSASNSYLYWFISYQKNNSDDTFSIQVDAKTGETSNKVSSNSSSSSETTNDENQSTNIDTNSSNSTTSE